MSDLALVGVVVACLLASAWRPQWLAAMERGLLTLLRRPSASWPWLVGLGLVAFLGQLAVASLVGFPEPRLHDDFSQLLAADTFARGRLANPTHPLWRHFETFHVLVQPTYASKYPPAQGLVLALGARLGNPAFGVWLAGALFCVATAWALDGLVRRPWARLGGVLAACTLVIASPWSQQYSGGFVAATGGALLFGGAARLLRKARTRDGVALGAGLAILAASRPWEGLVVSIVALAPLGWQVVRAAERRRALARAAAAAALVVAAAGGWLGWYQWRVTGSPWTMPYRLYDERYATVPVFLWESPRTVEPSPHPVVASYFRDFEGNEWRRQHTLGGWARAAAEKTSRLWVFYFGTAGTIALAGLPWALQRRGPRWALAGLGALLLSQLVILPSRPHYVAPGACLVVLLVVEGWRQLRLWRRRAPTAAGANRFGSRLGARLATALVIALVAVMPLRARALRVDPFEWHLQRAMLQRRLERMPERQLVLVRYGLAHDPGAEWVYNDADLLGTRVLWARSMGIAKDCRLLAHERKREASLLDVVEDLTPPRLVPYPRAACAGLAD